MVAAAGGPGAAGGDVLPYEPVHAAARPDVRDLHCGSRPDHQAARPAAGPRGLSNAGRAVMTCSSWTERWCPPGTGRSPPPRRTTATQRTCRPSSRRRPSSCSRSAARCPATTTTAPPSPTPARHRLRRRNRHRRRRLPGHRTAHPTLPPGRAGTAAAVEGRAQHPERDPSRPQQRTKSSGALRGGGARRQRHRHRPVRLRQPTLLSEAGLTLKT